MKKLFILAAFLGLCTAGTQAQGLIGVNNSLTSLVTYYNGFSNAPSSGVVGAKVELFYQPGGPTAPPSILYGGGGFLSLGAWEPTVGNNPFALSLTANGRFSAGNESTGLDVAPGGNAWFTLIEWTGGYSSFQAALAGGGQVGESSIFELTTGGGGTPPSTPVPLTASTPGAGFVAGTPFNGIVIGFPEPSIIAIGSLGAVVLLIFRRRK